jgi:hypothetical protein
VKAGLVGYSQTGKTTLFNALTGLEAQTGLGRSTKPNLGVVRVPDVRVDRLSEIWKPKKTVFAEVLFVDVPGPTSQGSGLDPATIQALREVDALVLVLRGFAAADGKPADPVRELGDFEAELLLHDLSIVERRLERLRKEGKPTPEIRALEACHQALDATTPLRLANLDADLLRQLTSFSFLSLQPLLVVLNVAEPDLPRGMPDPLAQACAARRLDASTVCAEIEAEIARLPPAEQAEFLASLGITEPAAAALIRRAYHLLDYVSFFTVGEDEVRAWTTRRGDRAPRAAGRVHSDIERGFIRAEVMTYPDFMQYRSEAAVRDAGRLRVEGKNYEVQDGDILHFRFNV